MTKSKIFLIICLSFIVGIYLGPVLGLISAFAGMIISIVSGTLIPHRIIKVAAASVFGLCIGMVLIVFQSKESTIAIYYGQKVGMNVTITEEPDVRSNKTFLTVTDSQKQKLLLIVPKYPEFRYGDAFFMSGKITEPPDAESPGEFSYKNYLSRFGISGLVYYPNIFNVTAGHGNKIKTAIFKIKQKFSNSIDQTVSEPVNSFLKGILIGDRREISDEIMEQFRVTGTTHLIAISGFNITIIAQALSKILDRFGRRIFLPVSLLTILGFVILTGASASVVRAGIMAALGLIALNLGRLHMTTNALVLAAVIMLVQNPKILRFDLGFQLSFLALLGLVYLIPVFEKFWDAPQFIKSYLYPTIAAQLFTLPLLLYNFGQLSIVAPLTNMLVLPLIPLSMLLGFVTGIAGIINVTLAAPIGWISWFVLSVILKLVEVTSVLPFSSINIQSVPIAVPIICYALILLFFILYSRQLIWKPKINV